MVCTGWALDWSPPFVTSCKYRLGTMDSSHGSQGLSSGPVLRLAATAGSLHRGRSRSPQRNCAWMTGNVEYDQAFADIGFEHEDLGRLAQIANARRFSMIRGIVIKWRSGSLDNPTAYLRGALTRHFHEQQAREQAGRPAQEGALHGCGAGSLNSDSVSCLPQAVGQGPPSALRSEGGVSGSDGFIKALASLRTDPPSMIFKFKSVLTATQAQWYESRMPFEQMAFALSFVLASPEDSANCEHWFSRLMQRYGDLCSESPVVPTGPPEVRPRVVLQVVLAGLPALSAMAVMTEVIAVQHVHVDGVDIPIDWMQPVLVHDKQSVGFTLERCRELPQFRNVHMRCFPTGESLLRDAERDVSSLRSNHVKFVVFTVAPPHASDVKLKRQSGMSVLHGQNAHTFDVLTFVDGIRTLLGDESICEAIMVQEQDSGRHVSDVWGEKVRQQNSTPWLQVRPTSAVYAVPNNMVIAQVVPDKGLQDTPLSGQARAHVLQLPSFAADECVRPSALDKFTQNVLFMGVMPTDSEKQCLAMLKSGHVSGQPSLPGRQWWLQWWCLKPEMTAELYDKHMPCAGIIDNINGRAAAHTGGLYSKLQHASCGHVRYCERCSNIFKDLDAAFPEASMLNTIMAMVSSCVPHWIGRRSGLQNPKWGRPEPSKRGHVCNEKCTGYVQPRSSGSGSSQY